MATSASHGWLLAPVNHSVIQSASDSSDTPSLSVLSAGFPPVLSGLFYLFRISASIIQKKGSVGLDCLRDGVTPASIFSDSEE